MQSKVWGFHFDLTNEGSKYYLASNYSKDSASKNRKRHNLQFDIIMG